MCFSPSPFLVALVYDLTFAMLLNTSPLWLLLYSSELLQSLSLFNYVPHSYISPWRSASSFSWQVSVCSLWDETWFADHCTGLAYPGNWWWGCGFFRQHFHEFCCGAWEQSTLKAMSPLWNCLDFLILLHHLMLLAQHLNLFADTWSYPRVQVNAFSVT